MEWANLIVPSVISIIGFIFTYYSMCRRFKNVTKQQITEEQRKIYLEVYIDVEKVVTTNAIIFESEYYDKLVSYKAKMKLAASNAVINAYNEYMRFVFKVAFPAWKWLGENYPEVHNKNLEYINVGNAKECEIARVIEKRNKKLKNDYEKYKEEHIPNANEIVKRVDDLLNVMRADLGNEAFIRNDKYF